MRARAWAVALALAAAAPASMPGQAPAAAPVAAADTLQRAGPGDEPVVPHPLTSGEGLTLNRVLRLSRLKDAPDAGTLAARIAVLQPAVAALGLQLLEERRLPPVDDGTAQILSEPQEALLLAGLAACAPPSLRAAAAVRQARAEHEPLTSDARAALILALGVHAEPRQLAALCRLALGSGELRPTAAAARALRHAATGLFARHPLAHEELAVRWRDQADGLLAELVPAAGAQGDPRALPFLALVLRERLELEPLVLAELTRQQAPPGVQPELLQALRERLDPERPMVCQSASTALAALGDFDSAGELATLLELEGPLAATAQRALQELSGLRLPPQAAAWRTWSARESSWYDQRAQALEDALENGSEAQAAAALRELAQHRWRRGELSDIAVLALARPEPGLRALACDTLAQLNARRCLPALLATCEDESDLVAERARAALQQIDPRQVPPPRAPPAE